MATTTLQINGLHRRTMSELVSKAKHLGVSPERYVRDLLEGDLEFDRKAQTTTLKELMGPGQDIDEADLDKMVDAARKRHHRKVRLKAGKQRHPKLRRKG
jgi:hypothetical protein